MRLIAVAPFATVPAGPDSPPRVVHRVVLRSHALRVELLTLGAAVHRVLAPDRWGRPGDVHLHVPDLEVRLRGVGNPYLGVSVGRYANRIAGARFPLEGRVVELAPNEGPNQLHGGPDGFHLRVWDLVDHGSGPHGEHATFALVSPAGDQGFPGALRAEATYRVAGDTLTITYRATADAPTVANLCHHGYWNLDGSTSVADHRLEVAADRYLPVDAEGIPLGGLSPVAGTGHDLRQAVRVGDVVAALPGGLDHSYAVGDPGGLGEVFRPGVVRRVARLVGATSGRSMEVHTDQPALQVYAGAHLGPPFAPFGGICLEAQCFPDTPNRPELGTALLRPGEEAASATELHFGVIGG